MLVSSQLVLLGGLAELITVDHDVGCDGDGFVEEVDVEKTVDS